jgi:hypothetical protein
MSTNPNPLGPVAVTPATPDPAASAPPVPARKQPTKILPTERINTAKQMDILRAYAAASNNGARAVSLTEVSEIVKMAVNTVSLANAFLNNVGLIQRSEAGSYLPSAEALSFLRAYEWNPETASHKIGPVLKDTWFSNLIMPRITYGPIEEDQAIAQLADAANAGPEYRKQLKAILEFMAYGGLILREGGQIRLMKTAVQEAPVAPKRSETQQPAEREPARKPGQNVTTNLQSTGGGVTFNVDVAVDMAEFATWRPERIQAFFRGIAEVLAAKADVEKGGQSL